MPAAKRSAGVLLYRLADGAPEVLLVHPGGPWWTNKDAGAWSIPKGEHGEDEDPRACALREFEEETGTALASRPFAELGAVRLKSGKLVVAWAAEGDLEPEQIRSDTFELEWPPRSGRLRAFPEVDRAGWFALEEAREKLNPAQVPFLDRLRGARRLGDRQPLAVGLPGLREATDAQKEQFPGFAAGTSGLTPCSSPR